MLVFGILFFAAGNWLKFKKRIQKTSIHKYLQINFHLKGCVNLK
jgi:hypothetical protein